MKIIKKGIVTPKTWKKTCKNCGTEFEYNNLDIRKGWCEGPYVKCPVCKARI